jgi:peptidyl-prolyl cis-trans isomerase SurA
MTRTAQRRFGTVLAVMLLLASGGYVRAQQVLDRIVVRIENDVILLSELRALSRYQKFVDGKAESDQQILDRLVDQWIVRTEADTARFAHPAGAEIDRSLDRLRRSFGSPEEYEARKKESGQSDGEVRAMIASQLYLSSYLDSRFRPVVQIDSHEIEKFYQETLVPRAKARGQEPPTLDTARETIQELLVQQAISAQAEQWIKESRDRLHVDKLLTEAGK